MNVIIESTMTRRNKKIMLFTLPLIILISGIIMFVNCSTFGTPPKGVDLSRIERSPQYNRDKGEFQNRLPDLVDRMQKRLWKLAIIKEWFTKREQGIPDKKLPEVRPDISEFLKISNYLKVIWFGHSSVLLNLSGKIILIDPMFSGSASPVGFMVKRFQDPAIKLHELPEIDYIIITHDHYDHLDMKSVKFFKNKRAEFITPLGVGSHLKGWGITEKRITELDWWESILKGDIELITAPAQHFSGRSLTKRNKTLWASFIIRNKKHNIYFSGDSGYDIHFKEIGKRYGPFELAFVETGQYNEKWKEVHMLPSEAAQAYFDLKAKRFFPIHWGMFELALHTWYQPAVDISREAGARGISLITPKLGEIISVNVALKTSCWWETIINIAKEE